MTELVAIGAGGALGAVGRYGLSLWVGRRLGEGFPFGTLFVNVLGCLALGALLGYIEEAGGFSPRVWSVALGNVALNVLVGLAAVVAGIAAVNRLSS